MLDSHIKKLDDLLVESIHASQHESSALRTIRAGQAEHYAVALAALYAAKQTVTAEDALWCAEYTAALDAGKRRFGTILTTEERATYAEQRNFAAKDANEAVELFRKRNESPS